MKRAYELTFIVRLDGVDEALLNTTIDQVRAWVETEELGQITKIDRWGRRKMAYEIDKQREGYYVLLTFTTEPAVVREFERRMRVQDSVIKFLTVRIDETLKRIEKRKKVREKRALRRPKPVAAQPSLAQQMLGGGSEEAHAAPGLPVVPQHAAPGAPAPAAAEPVAEPAAVTPAATTKE